MKIEKHKEIFFHVGLGKTGSTYLQYKVFTKFRNVYYIQRTKYKKSFEIINKTNYNRYLVSNELDRQFPDEIRRISASFPDAKIIMVLRRNDSWLASQYRRWVKNGYSGSFDEFIDLKNDHGEWKQKEAFFWPYIELVMKIMHSKPLVLLYDELREDPHSFIKKIVDFIGADYDPDTISLKKIHKSYNKKQLLQRRKWNKHFSGNIKLSKSKILAFIQTLFYVKPIRYGSLYLAKIIPDEMVHQEELTPKNYLDQLYNFYKEDWEKCVNYSKTLDNRNITKVKPIYQEEKSDRNIHLLINNKR